MLLGAHLPANRVQRGPNPPLLTQLHVPPAFLGPVRPEGLLSAIPVSLDSMSQLQAVRVFLVTRDPSVLGVVLPPATRATLGPLPPHPWCARSVLLEHMP